LRRTEITLQKFRQPLVSTAPQRLLMLGGERRFTRNDFISSPTMWSQSAALPPFPHSSSLPPCENVSINRSSADWMSSVQADNCG
jgi:hypothetical protein